MSNTEHNELTEQPETMEQPMDLATARRVEQDKMTRRAALRKLGFGAGLAAFSLLGVDDFARMVGQRMERMAGDNKVAHTVAKEFQQAGVVFANGPGALPCGPSGCSGCGSSGWGNCCLNKSSGDPDTCCQHVGNNNGPGSCESCCEEAYGTFSGTLIEICQAGCN